MTAKEHLQTVYSIQQRIKRLNEMREDIRNDLYSLGGIDYSADRVQTSPEGDRMLKLIARVDEIERDVLDELKELEERKYNIIKEIECVPNENYKQLLFERYVLCEKWEKISLDHDRGIRRTFTMHGKALAAFEKIWGKAL